MPSNASNRNFNYGNHFTYTYPGCFGEIALVLSRETSTPVYANMVVPLQTARRSSISFFMVFFVRDSLWSVIFFGEASRLVRGRKESAYHCIVEFDGGGHAAGAFVCIRNINDRHCFEVETVFLEI